jgi:N-methylhydantoinase A/oxoprolinase/acetone carboxylase beta subunit
MGKLINIDNGGTLTDIWVLDGDQSYHTKTITTPYDLSKCFFEGLKKVSQLIYGQEDMSRLLHTTDHIRYSTTQGTNALVQKKGPRIGIILTSERDIDSLQQTDKEREMFEALVGNRVAVIDSTLEGEAYIRGVTDAIASLSSAGASRLVVSFDGADYAERESLLQKAILRAFPRHLLGTVPVVYASEVVGDVDFRRRSWSALYNAFLHPSMELFLYHAEAGLREERAKNPLLIFRNDGGSSRVAKTVALKTYGSGPRGGAEGLKAAADYYDFKHLLMMDVGGTTTDFSEVTDGQVRTLPHGKIGGVECSYPLCDIVSIGAGGGSIFRVKDGAITVGPDSVGGAPGPACFGMGGTEATITDALLVMGLLDPATYFGGEMNLDFERAMGVIRGNIADPLGVSPEEAVQQMIKALAEKTAIGINDFTEVNGESVLMGFGGGGPMNVLSCAEVANIDTVLVPRLAAVYSAFGIGFSDISHAYRHALTSNDQAGLESVLEELRTRAARDMFSEGFELSGCEIELNLIQGEQSLPLDADQPRFPESAPEGLSDETAVLSMKAVKTINHAEIRGESHCVISDAVVGDLRLLKLPEGEEEVPVYRVEEQLAGAAGQGPCVIEEAFFTCRVLPGWSFEFTDNRDILLKKAN